jgi:hypothetical protein
MAIKKRKTNDEERLEDSNIERVIAYLEEEKGATKKTACTMLNIAYNTSRLDKIIESYLTKKARDAERRAEKRGKPVTKEEASFIISEYLAGTPIAVISKSVYRGPALIKSTLLEYAIPERQQSPNYFKPNLIPDEAVRESFNIGETVYSARYDTLATIEKEYVQNDEFIYRVYLRGDWLQYAMQPAHELASLAKLRECGLQL